MKTCSKCEEEKPLGDFAHNKNSKDGHSTWCKNCHRVNTKSHYDPEYYRAYREANPERFLKTKQRFENNHPEYYQEYYEEHQDKIRERARVHIEGERGRALRLLASARKRAKKKRIPFDLDLQWLLTVWQAQAGNCEACCPPHTFDLISDPNHFRNPDAPSLDRIDPKQGYTKENTRLVCCWYNMAKNDLSDEDFRRRCGRV